MMEKEKYLNYLEDKEVIKIPDWTTVFLKNKNLSVDITYFHFGSQRVWHSNPNNVRLHVSTFIGDFIPEIPNRIISDETILLLNSREENLAHAWVLKIDNKNNNVSLSLKDYPQVGMSLISDEESNGLIFNLE